MDLHVWQQQQKSTEKIQSTIVLLIFSILERFDYP